MLWLDSECENNPSFLFALCFYEFLATILEFSSKKRLAALGTPDEMIDNEMDSMFISLVLKFALFCRFHIDNIQHFRHMSRANATDASPPGLKPQRLAAG